MKIYLFLIGSFLSNWSFTQTLNLTIKPVFGDKPITEDTWFVSEKGDSIQLENVRFYLSNIQFERADKTIIHDTEKAHLIDVFDTKTLTIPFKTVNFKPIKTLRFNIGIDSLTNVSGALSGDLDPQKGMYWAWQSGYINMKIEGKSPKLRTRKNQFQFHIGGYLSPFYALKSVELPLNMEHSDIPKAFGTEGVSPKNPTSDIPNPTYTEGVILVVDVAKFFKNINIAMQKSIMLPCKEAIQLADFSVQMFSIE